MDTIKIEKQYSNFRREDREYKSICYTPKNLVNLRKRWETKTAKYLRKIQ